MSALCGSSNSKEAEVTTPQSLTCQGAGVTLCAAPADDEAQSKSAMVGFIATIAVVSTRSCPVDSLVRGRTSMFEQEGAGWIQEPKL